MTEAGPSLWGLRWFFSFQLLLFLLEKQLVGQGGMSPGMRGDWKCLHPQNPPKRTCPDPTIQQSTQTSKQTLGHHVCCHFPPIPSFSLKSGKISLHRESLSLKGPKKNVWMWHCLQKSPQLSPRSCLPSLGRWLSLFLMIVPISPNENLPFIFCNSSRLSHFRPRSVAFSPFDSYFCRVILGRMPPTFCQALICNYRVRSSSSSNCSSL